MPRHLETTASTTSYATKQDMHRTALWGGSEEYSGYRRQSTVRRAKHPPWRRWLRRNARIMCENRFFISFGTMVTIWALAGDDLRLWFTNKPDDKYFDGIVVFNFLFFSFEIVVSCLGKSDYFMGFFFGLDVISTGTLFLDLSAVSEAMFASGGDGSDNARTGRTARVGAKIGRVVRVLRLIRIVRLYKAITSSKTVPDRKPNTDDWDYDSDEEAEQADPGKESLVGKKLSAKTTQRTIILVLTLLIVLPLLSTSSLLKLPASGQFGAEEVSKAFRQFLNGTNAKDAYEEVMLKYIYYHNWFQGRLDCPGSSGCSSMYYSHLFWAGIVGKADQAVLQNHSDAAQISPTKVESWNREAGDQDNLFNFGTFPAEVLPHLSAQWQRRCRFGGATHFGFSVLGKEVTDAVDHVVQCPEDIRNMERDMFTERMITQDQFRKWHFVFYFDLRPYIRREAALNILTTVFICVVLCVASLFFSNDASSLVLTPVEQMIEKVEAIRDDPLKATEMADAEFKREEMRRSAEKNKDQQTRALDAIKQFLCCKRHQQRGELMETVILEKTIIKLGSLLALGFGEAGANIVSQNMRGSDTSGVNAMVSGRRVDCIVGNVRICDFSTATEVLQEEVMQFVNRIAEIVHGVVDEFHGAANKNTGDTFLIIWRTAGVPLSKASRMADMSVYAFAKILGGVHRSIVLAAYRYHPGLQQRLGSDCRVNLSFGLHCGWAIEGAVGSEFKIDASYLSPNVSIAACVEHATRIYSVSILVSEKVARLCSKEMMANMRLVDKVRFVGTKDPIELYCLDLDYLNLPVDEPLRKIPIWNTAMRYRSRQYLEDQKSMIWADDAEISNLFEDDSHIACMRSAYTEDFRQQFNMGYQNYAQGEWTVANQLLSQTLAMLRRQDGPSWALLRYMGTHRFMAPTGWAGVRDFGRSV